MITNGNRSLGGTDAGRLRALVDAIDAVIYEADLAGWVKFVNRRAVDLLGYPRERWLSQPSFWQAITYCDDRSKVTDHFALCAKDGQRRELEYRLVAANGRIVWVRESLAASLDGPADDHLLRAVMWRIDRPKKADDQLVIARRQLAEQLADMTQLHDLSQLLWATPDLEPLLQEILRAAMAIQGADMGTLRIYDPARGTMEIAAHIGLPKRYIEDYGLVPPGDVACGLAMERGCPLIIDDVDAEESGSPYRRHRPESGAIRRVLDALDQPQRRADRRDCHLLPRAAPPEPTGNLHGRAFRPPGRRLHRERAAQERFERGRPPERRRAGHAGA